LQKQTISRHLEGRADQTLISIYADTVKLEVLFVCVHNAGRSQMAAALTKLRSDGRITVRSGGTAPASEVNPSVVQVMAELDINLGAEQPKPITDATVRASDVVITMGCGDACPVYPGKRYDDWELEDPTGKDLATVRRIRDEIDAHVKLLVDDLLQ
jgi:protein-tyrosine-phosphatase